VSWRLAARVHGPLMIVRGDHPHEEHHEVLLGLESDADETAAAYAFQEAARRGARLRVLHSSTHRHLTPELPSPVAATSPGQERESRNDRAEEAVSRFSIARLREDYPGVQVDGRTVRTGPAHALLSETREVGVVVIGTRQHPGRPAPPLGPVAQVLAQHAHCPVVLVPAARGRAQR
jgi:nucleotide-binding universal stress UspA family protein